MKKAISLLLAFVLFLSLCACVEENQNPENNISAGTVTSTHYDAPEEIAPAGTVAGESENSGATVPSAEWLSYLCGTWEVLYRDDVDKIGTVEFYEEGTVTIGERSLSWKLQEENDGLIISLISNGSLEGSFGVYLTDERDLSAYIQIDDEEIALYKPSYYEIIPITLDNVDEYFEMKYFMDIKENGFGEVSGILIYAHYALKDEYYARISEQMMDDSRDYNIVDAGAAEFSLERGNIELQIDPANQTFEFVGFEPQRQDTYIKTPGSGGFWGDCYGFALEAYTFSTDINLDIETGMADNTNSPYNFELVRIDTMLYLIAEND